MKYLTVLFIILLAIPSISTKGGEVVSLGKKQDALHSVVSIFVVTHTVNSVDDGIQAAGVVIFADPKKKFSYILTVHHLIDFKLEKIVVTLYPSGLSYPATIRAKDKERDLAIIRIEVAHPFVAKMKAKKLIPVFTKILRIGRSYSDKPYPVDGIVSMFDPEKKMLVSTPMWYGDSGGAAFTEDDLELIGISTSVMTHPFGYISIPVSHIAYITTMYEIQPFLESFFKKKVKVK